MLPTQDKGAELRVLVVDDHVDAATTLTSLLALLGCRAAYAFGPETALRIATLFRPELIIIDLDMPGRDGCQLLEVMRDQNEQLGQALYVCLTGRSEPDDKARCEAAGFERFYSKPLDPAELQNLIAEALARRDMGLPGHAPHRHSVRE